MKFCTRHDSYTVVTCAKFRCDRQSTFLNQSTAYFGQISNSIEISLVGRAHGPIYCYITHGTTTTAAELKSNFKLTTDTPYLPHGWAMGCLLWGFPRKLTML